MQAESIIPVTRRRFLAQCGMGLGSLAAHTLEAQSAMAQLALGPKSSPMIPKARRMIHIFLNGGLSHIDSLDPKPLLQKYAGQSLPMGSLRTERKTGAAFPSAFPFRRRGRSGLEMSDLFPRIAEHADELCVIRSMKVEVPNHEPSLMLMNCGDAVMSRPSLGSWVTYGLGSENQNLPGFVVLCPNGLPIKESENWRAGFLPGAFQGTHIDTRHTDLEKLIENIRSEVTPPAGQHAQLELLRKLNQWHRETRESDPQFEARMQSYELAYRMQWEATDALDIANEPDSIRALYGDTIHGRQTLMARRLLERGVRFVQLWHGGGQPWDSHDEIEKNHGKLAHEIDQPVAALLTDLKVRGMLDDTLVLFTGEFGRTPVVEIGDQGKSKLGRDHNPYGFSLWMAGGGVRGGMAYGATDEFGFRAVDKVVEVYDLHATILHLLGFDHEKFTFRYAGRDFRLTDVHGNVIQDILA